MRRRLPLRIRATSARHLVETRFAARRALARTLTVAAQVGAIVIQDPSAARVTTFGFVSRATPAAGDTTSGTHSVAADERTGLCLLPAASAVAQISLPPVATTGTGHAFAYARAIGTSKRTFGRGRPRSVGIAGRGSAEFAFAFAWFT